jgi:UbiD family decarboxylase
VTVTKDIDTGKRNVGWYRYGFFDLDHEGKVFSDEMRKKHMNACLIWNPPSGHGGMNYLKARKKNIPLEIAWAGPCDPAIHVLGSVSLQYGQDEFAHAGTLRGKPVELVKCETVDLEVPATAEWVIEGEVLPEDSYMGTHGQYCGYLDPPWSIPPIRIKCITHRKDPLWYMTCSMFPPFDHYYLLNMLTELELFHELRSRLSDLIDSVVVHGPLGLFVIQTSVDGVQKPNIEFGKNIIYAVWSSRIRFARTAKYVIVVGPDVDPYKLDQVVWAMSTRCQPYSDSVINRSGEAFALDPSAYEIPGPFTGKVKSEQMGIDALIKIPERFNEYPPVCEPSKEAVKKIEAKIKDIFK